MTLEIHQFYLKISCLLLLSIFLNCKSSASTPDLDSATNLNRPDSLERHFIFSLVNHAVDLNNESSQFGATKEHSIEDEDSK